METSWWATRTGSWTTWTVGILEISGDDGSRIQDHKLVHVGMLVSLFLRNTRVMPFFRQVILIHFLEVCTFFWKEAVKG